MYFGYDITELDLLPWDHATAGPDGMRAKVLASSCDQGRKVTYGKEYDEINVPDQVCSCVFM